MLENNWCMPSTILGRTSKPSMAQHQPARSNTHCMGPKTWFHRQASKSRTTNIQNPRSTHRSPTRHPPTTPPPPPRPHLALGQRNSERLQPNPNRIRRAITPTAPATHPHTATSLKHTKPPRAKPHPKTNPNPKPTTTLRTHTKSNPNKPTKPTAMTKQG